MTELKSSDEYYRDIVAKKSEVKKSNLYGIYCYNLREINHTRYVTHKWTGKYGTKDIDDFKASRLVQEIAFRESLAQIWDELKDYHHYEGQSIKGITITKSGMLTAAFYVGRRPFKNFLDTSGTTDTSDGYKMKCSNYLKEFAGYDIDYSIEDLVEQRYEEGRQWDDFS